MGTFYRANFCVQCEVLFLICKCTNLYINFYFLLGIYTLLAKQKDPNAAPVPQPDNAEQELKVLKKEVIPSLIFDVIIHIGSGPQTKCLIRICF